MEGVPYSLKFSRTKNFVDFVVFEAPRKILSLKISYKLANQRATNLYRTRFAMVHWTYSQRESASEQRVRWDINSMIVTGLL